MATYLVYEPAGSLRTQDAAERVVFLRDRFSPWAFIFTPLWLLRYRLWLVFGLWLLVFVAIQIIGVRLGFGPYAAAAASFFPSLLIAMEAASLRARKLARLGYREAAVLIAEDLDTAERRFFETWRTTPASSSPPSSPNGSIETDYPYPPASAPPAQPQTRTASASEGGVIGLFPNPGNRA